MLLSEFKMSENMHIVYFIHQGTLFRHEKTKKRALECMSNNINLNENIAVGMESVIESNYLS